MFVPSFSHLHRPPRNPHAGPPGLVSRPQRPSRRCCVRTCVVAFCSDTPTAPERTICRHPADWRPCVRRRAGLSSSCCCPHSLKLAGKRNPRRRRGGHARPLLLACRYAGTAHGPVGPLPLACCPSLAVDGCRLRVGRRVVEEDPSPFPCPPILASQTWPLARNGEQMDLRQDLTLHVWAAEGGRGRWDEVA